MVTILGCLRNLLGFAPMPKRHNKKRGTGMRRTITVKATYDPDADVWFIEESNLPGLSAEAKTVEALAAKLPGMVVDLFEENGILDGVDDHGRPPIELIAHQFISTKRYATA